MKDEFGRSLPYAAPSIDGHEDAIKGLILEFIMGVAEGKTREEQMSLLRIAHTGVHLFIDYIMKNLPDGVERVDGSTVMPYLKEVVIDLLEGYYAHITINITGDGQVSGVDKVLKGDDAELYVTGDVISCTEEIVDGTITLAGLVTDVVIDIEFAANQA